MKTDYTKQFLARSLVQLMKTTPLDKISVSEITEECGLNRHTFYYHFKDKQDLICWIFDNDISDHFDTPSTDDINAGMHDFYFRKIIEFMFDNRLFYINALNASGQNSLNDHLYDFIYSIREIQIDAILKGRRISPEARRFLADYFSCAICGLITRWAENNMQNPPDVFYSKFHNVSFQCMEYLIENYFDEVQ